MVSADHRRQRGAGPTIALEHVLQDFFAAFVLEVHIDIRWLVALPGEKALKQHVHSLGVDLGDAQGETHRRVGRRASALAENLLAPGEGDDVLNGQEIAFITQLGDQPELLVDQPANLFACTVGPSLAHAALGQRPQPGLCAVPFWHQFARILITQLAKIKGTAPGDVQRFCQQAGRIKFPQHVQAAQMAFAVGMQAQPGIGHRQVMTDRGHGVLQGAPAASMHVHNANRPGNGSLKSSRST
ncbi:hypothetical protein D3C79_771320 [compost metagenome]